MDADTETTVVVEAVEDAVDEAIATSVTNNNRTRMVRVSSI